MKSVDHLKLFLRTKIFKKFENLSRFELVLRQKSCEGDVCDILKISLTESENCHQPSSSPLSVTNIVVI